MIKSGSMIDLCKPETSPAYQQFSIDAYEYLYRQQAICKDQYQIGQYESWFYDQHTGLLTFRDGDETRLKILYQVVGSVSKVSHTWLWSWANPHLTESIYEEMFGVKEYGEIMGYERLCKRKWEANQQDGWEMTAAAAFILKAKGAYRIPAKKTWTFVVFMDFV
jgi:hypothetical protein